MSGKIIAFRSHQNLNRANLYRRRSVPRGLTKEVRLKLQIARISALLEELEELTGTSIGRHWRLAAACRAGARDP